MKFWQSISWAEADDDYKRLQDMGVTATFLPPSDAGGVDRNRTAGLGRSSSLDAKKRVMERAAETILRHVA